MAKQRATQRLALVVEYKGAAYHGWQDQQNELPTVEGRLKQALENVADHPIETLVCSGRTDKGVHALGQVVHVDVQAERELQAWVMGANAHLPDDIRVLEARAVSDDFHARYSATSRSYRYVIDTRPVRSCFAVGRSAWHPYALDADLMHQAAQCWLGEQDCSSFRAQGCQSHSVVRNIMKLNVQRTSDHEVVVEVQANAFLYHMVRNMVGTLMAIGAGRQPLEWAKEVLEARDRRAAGKTAPAEGLYFIGPEYP